MEADAHEDHDVAVADQTIDDDVVARAVLARCRIGLAVLDRSLVFRWVNDPMGELFGGESGRLLGQSALDFIHPDDVGRAADAAREIIDQRADGSPGDFGLPVELRLQVATGEYIAYECAAVAAFDDPVIDGFVLRIRPLRGQDLVDAALHAMADDAPLEEILDLLVGAVNERVESGVATLRRARHADGLPPSVTPVAHPSDLRTVEAGDEPPVPGVVRVLELPVRCRSEQVTIVVWRFVAHEMLRSSVHAVAQIGDVIGLAIDRDADIAGLRHRADHDPLTGVENRRRFEQRLHAVVSRGRKAFGLLFIDLDHFKPINDELGHAVGDAVLRAVAQRIRGAVRPTDRVARFGGDEFVVLCTDVDDVWAVARVADRVLASFGSAIAVGNDAVDVSASIGIVWQAAGHVSTVEDVLARADQALYDAKQVGRGVWRVAPQPD